MTTMAHPCFVFTHQIDRFKQKISRLSIGTKIGLGYALVVGLTAIGTIMGVAIADQIQQRAHEQGKDAEEEIELVKQLQESVLQVRNHQQQFVYLLDQPEELQEEYEHYLHHIAEAKQVWTEFKQTEGRTKGSESEEFDGEIEEIERFIQTHNQQIEAYLAEVEVLLKQLDLMNLQPEELDVVKAKLLDFGSSSVSLELEIFWNNLHTIIETFQQENDWADKRERVAAELRHWVVATALVLSSVLAIGLAIAISRAITRPLQNVTKVAQRMQDASDFELRAAVTAQDEVGILAQTLNQLLDRVQKLMAEQQTEVRHQLVQQEKMSSLGRMIAGVAHEINNPINFIYGNLDHAEEYIADLLMLLEIYETACIPTPPTVQAQVEAADLEFMREDLPKLLRSMHEGASRVRQIVLSLKNFSRIEEDSAYSIDLHECIDSTLLILNNRIKQGITVVRQYSNLPLIEGYAGGLYQVLMNLLSNAIDAIEAAEPPHPRQISITTERLDTKTVCIRIRDSGIGIAIEHQPHIFETFFTSKPLGVGTGLGLSISREIVVEKHGGDLSFVSEPGQGTEFSIVLPIHLFTKASLSETIAVPA